MTYGREEDLETGSDPTEERDLVGWGSVGRSESRVGVEVRGSTGPSGDEGGRIHGSVSRKPRGTLDD